MFTYAYRLPRPVTWCVRRRRWSAATSRAHHGPTSTIQYVLRPRVFSCNHRCVLCCAGEASWSDRQSDEIGPGWNLLRRCECCLVMRVCVKHVGYWLVSRLARLDGHILLHRQSQPIRPRFPWRVQGRSHKHCMIDTRMYTFTHTHASTQPQPGSAVQRATEGARVMRSQQWKWGDQVCSCGCVFENDLIIANRMAALAALAEL